VRFGGEGANGVGLGFGGLGAEIGGNFTLSAGEVLDLYIGQQGGTGSSIGLSNGAAVVRGWLGILATLPVPFFLSLAGTEVEQQPGTGAGMLKRALPEVHPATVNQEGRTVLVGRAGFRRVWWRRL
jgi:hypothetical protein